MYTKGSGATSLKKTIENDKYVQRQRERMERARDEKERIRMIKERGIPASTGNNTVQTESSVTS